MIDRRERQRSGVEKVHGVPPPPPPPHSLTPVEIKETQMELIHDDT